MAQDPQSPGGTAALGPQATQRLDVLGKTEPPRTRASSHGGEEPACEPGTMVDHFQVIRLIGRGGMGEVYLAYDTDLGRRVALKMIVGEWLSSEEAVERFLFEVRTTAKFNHPNIVTVYAAGKYRGRPYVALEYLQGQNLRQRMEERPPGHQEALRIMLAVVEALEEAHAHGVLHRDLKPENVILPLDGRLRVVDFGLAKQVRGVRPELLRPIWEEDTADSEQAEELLAAAEAASSSSRGSAPASDQGLKGTPAYMAPEQWLSQECTPATDVWAVGVILFELCAGRLPFDHDTIAKQLTAVCSADAAPRVDRLARVPEELSALIARCLDKDPSFRPLPTEVAATLRDMLYDTTAAVGGRESPYRGLMPFTERHAGLFFGREAEIAAFVERVRHHPVLPVVGASGAGKSSFVQAGIIPRLREQERWLVLQLRPGNQPFHALANRLIRGDSWQDRQSQQDSVSEQVRPSGGGQLDSADEDTAAPRPTDDLDDAVSVDAPTMVSPEGPTLVLGDPSPSEPPPAAGTDDSPNDVAPPSVTAQRLDALGEEIRRLAEQLLESPRRLSLRLRSLAEKQGVKVLLFVDQLEELFTLVDDNDPRERFIQALCTAAEDPLDPVRVVFSVRDDFLGRLAVSSEAREALTHVTVVQRLGPSALGQTLLRPAEVAGYRFDDETLVRRMVASVEGEPAGLPLLQFAAQMLWERRDAERQLLLQSAYQEIGGVEGALAKHADGVLDGLSPSELTIARELLLRLVTPERTRKVIGQAAALHGLRAAEDEHGDKRTAERVLGRLTAARLVNVSRMRGDDEAEAVLELAHESLIHTWTTLSRWIDEGREELAFVAEVSQAAELWDRRGRRPEELWRGSAVEEALRTAERCTTPLPELVVDFLRAAQVRHLRRLRRVRAAIASAIGLSVAVAVVATLIALFVADKEREAREQRDLAEQREARALEEGARAALGDGRLLEARAKLRAALEKEQSASTSARGLWWQLERNPLLWTQEFGATVYSVAFSPDGKTVAAGCQDHAVYLLDAETRATRVLRGHTDQILAVAFSPDGQQLASASWDGQIRIWDVAAGVQRKLIQGHEAGVRSLAFDPSGARLASGNYGNEARIWDLDRGRPTQVLTGHGSSVVTVGFDPGGRHLVSGSSDKTVRVWDARTGRSIAVCRGHADSVLSLDVSPDGQLIGTGSRDRTVRIWDLVSCQEKRVFDKQRAAVYAVRFSPDGRGIAAGTRDGAVTVFDRATGATTATFDGHEAGVWSIAIAPDGTRLVSGSSDNTARLWAIDVFAGAHAGGGHTSAAWNVAFDPQGAIVASAGMDGTVRLWDVSTGRPIRTLLSLSTPIRAAAFSRDGSQLAVAGDDPEIRILDPHSGQQLKRLSGHAAAVMALAFTGDGRLLASASLDDTVRLWDVDEGKVRHVLRGHSSGVNDVAFAPSSEVLASAGLDNAIRLWNANGGAAVQTLAGHTDDVWGVSFGPNARQLATTGTDGTVRLWDLSADTSTVVARHPGRGSAVAFHPDGRRLLSSGGDASVLLMDLASGAKDVLDGHQGDVNFIALSDDGKMAATAGDDHTVRLWDVDTLRPRWRAPVLLPGPPRLLTHRGWEYADEASRGGDALAVTRAVDAPATQTVPPSLRDALQSRARQADVHEETLCMSAYDDQVELWDMVADTRTNAQSYDATPRVLALGKACLVHTTDQLALLGETGAAQDLALDGAATAANRRADGALVATPGWIHLVSSSGEILRRQPVSAGEVTAVIALESKGSVASSRRDDSPERFVVGYREGNLELVRPDEAKTVQEVTFEQVPASAPVRMLTGPMNTLIVGYANGVVGIWNVDDGAQLARARLHGPTAHLLLEDKRLYAASTLGERLAWDLSPFYVEHCELVRQVWDQLPVVWRMGKPERRDPPDSHRCAR